MRPEVGYFRVLSFANEEFARPESGASNAPRCRPKDPELLAMQHRDETCKPSALSYRFGEGDHGM